MKRRWALRLLGISMVWGLTCAIALVYRLSPRPALVLVVILALAAALWLLTDLGTTAEPSRWYIAQEVRHVPRGADTRIGLLQRSLADPRDDRAFNRHLHPLLVSVVDDRLQRNHGVNRANQPTEAERILGPELAAFVQRPPGQARRDPHHLAMLMERIEAL